MSVPEQDGVHFGGEFRRFVTTHPFSPFPSRLPGWPTAADRETLYTEAQTEECPVACRVAAKVGGRAVDAEEGECTHNSTPLTWHAPENDRHDAVKGNSIAYADQRRFPVADNTGGGTSSKSQSDTGWPEGGWREIDRL